MTLDIKKLKQDVAKLSDGDFEKFGSWFYRLDQEREYRKRSSAKSGIRYADMLNEFKKRPLCSWDKKGRLMIDEASHGALIMREFYMKKRVRGCRLEEDEDLLIAEWGPASKTEFSLAYIRQVVPPRRPDRDTEIWQLRVDMRFPMLPQLERLKQGRRCFRSLIDAEFAFTDVPYKSRVGKVTEEMKPGRVIVTYENVE